MFQIYQVLYRTYYKINEIKLTKPIKIIFIKKLEEETEKYFTTLILHLFEFGESVRRKLRLKPRLRVRFLHCGVFLKTYT